jgi:hypothetical protein
MEYTISDLILSTITVEAKISNINFKEKELIELLSLEDKSDIIKIGCNFNEYISDTYLELTKPVKKSNRGRKKKVKPLSNRKIQGNGKYFNSQITFVCNENIEIIKPIINIIIKKIENLKNIKVDSDENIEIVYIKSIMRNYKFNLIEPEIYIDLYKFQSILLDYKNEQNDLDIYKLYNLELSLIKFFPERYTGIILKFKTPIPENQNKLTTVKIFSSGKMNIDGSNSLNESNNIKEIILYLLKKNKETILYTK